MIEKNKKINVDIESFGMDGDGVARYENSTIFIPNVLPSENCDITINKISNKKICGICTKINNISKNRVTPPCPFFDICGGCDLQHINYDTALDFKTQLVKNTFFKVAKLNVETMPCIKSNQLFYRNKIALAVANQNKKNIVGLFEKNSHNILEINNCIICEDFLKPVLDILKDYIKNISCFNYATKKGYLKHIVIRHINGSVLITLVCTNNKIKTEDLQNKLEKLKINFGLNLCINKNDNTILSNNITHICGLKKLENCINNINFEIDSLSFMQVNTQIQNKIYDFVIENIESSENCINAFSGAGLLSAMLAKKCNSVVGIEINFQATTNANNLMQKNKITNVTNICGDCLKVIPTQIKKLKNPLIVLDPPRAGCDKTILDCIKNADPNKIIYISCNPKTLARDCKILLENSNYQIKKIQPFDMFPQTKHVETVVIMEKV